MSFYKRCIRFLSWLFTALAEQWFVGAASLLIALIAQFGDRLASWITAVDWSNVFFVLRLIFWPLVSVIIATFVVRTWWKWRLVRVPGDPWYYSVDPLLRLTNRVLRHGSGSMVDRMRRCLSQKSGHSGMEQLFTLHNTSETSNHGLDPGERPVLIVKIPARYHLAVADFVVLRMVRVLMASGCAVLVVVLDARYDGNAGTDVDRYVKRTRHFVRRILGSGVQIKTLSNLVVAESPSAVGFLLRRFVPYFVTIVRGNNATDTNDYLVSLFLKAMIIHCLSRQFKQQPVIIAQWEDRLRAWQPLLQKLADWDESIRVPAFLVIRSFPNESGGPLGSQSADVALVPEGDWLREFIAREADGAISSYAQTFGYWVLGSGWDRGKISALLQRWQLTRNCSGITRCLQWVIKRQAPGRRLHEGIRRVQKDLTKGLTGV